MSGTFNKEQFVPYELAVKLKNLGFNEGCLGYLTESNHFSLKMKITNSKLEKNALNYRKKYKGILPDMVATLLWQQAFDWILENHNFYGTFEKGKNPENYYPVIKDYNGDNHLTYKYTPEYWFDTLYDTRVSCLNRLLDLIEETKKRKELILKHEKGRN